MDGQQTPGPDATLDDVERVLAVGRLLLSVLTSEEIEQLREELYGEHSRRLQPHHGNEKQVTLVSLDAEAGLP